MNCHSSARYACGHSRDAICFLKWTTAFIAKTRQKSFLTKTTLCLLMTMSWLAFNHRRWDKWLCYYIRYEFNKLSVNRAIIGSEKQYWLIFKALYIYILGRNFNEIWIKIKIFHWRKCIWNVVCAISTILFRSECVQAFRLFLHQCGR